MSHPVRVPRWNMLESSIKDWLEENQPKPIYKYWDNMMKHEVVVYEPRMAAGDIT